MKKSLIFFITIILLFILIKFIPAEVTGDTITGKPTSESLALNITVALPTTILTIISPENDTYLINETLLLNYSQVNADMVWYNVDLGSNTTITGAIYFDVSEGEHTLYLYGNNSYGLTSKNVSFTSNKTFLTILYSEYNGSTKGDSTNFISYSYGDLQSISEIILENSLYGKIKFNEIINITNDNLPNDGIIDLDNNTNISLNRIDLNYTALPNFNVSATLDVYNLPFTNPRILKEGAVCPSSICTFESFTNNTLKFNVTTFGIYSAEETPITETVTLPGSGGGGSSPIRVRNFSTDKESIQVSLKQGETTYEEIIIKNKERSNLIFKISIFDVEDFTKLSEEIFTLKPNEEKIIRIDFFAHEDASPNLYIGKLIIKTGTTQKDIPVAIEVESSEPLFDIKLKIPSQFKQIVAGDEVLAEIQLYNLGEIGRVDVNMDYIIKKESTGEVVLFEQDTLAVEEHIEFIKDFKIPENAELGSYIFYTRINYNDKVASATDTFKVSKNFVVFFNRMKFVLLVFVIISLILLITIIHNRRKEEEKSKKYKVSNKYRLKKIVIESD
jgi:hypothetical protein